jgi:MFS family permease
MKHKHAHHTGRWKVTGISIALFVGGIVLLILSNLVVQPIDTPKGKEKPLASAPAASAPAASTSAPATAPAEPRGKLPIPPEQRRAAAQNMSSMLMLIGLMGIACGAICAGWVVYDMYRSRPAWKTQTKYPRRR